MLVTLLSVSKDEKTRGKLMGICTTLLSKEPMVYWKGFVPFYLVPGQRILINKNNGEPGSSRKTYSSLRLLHL